MIILEHRFRDPKVGFWRCANERAQAQAAAREVEHLIAGGTMPERICILIDQPRRSGGAVAAAMEERGIPFTSAGRRRSFSAPRCAMQSPGCGYSSIQMIPQPRPER